MNFDAKGGAMTRFMSFVFLLVVIAGESFAANPPVFVNFEGVLRDQNGNPLTGTYGMLFRFMDAATLGNEISGTWHVNANAVIVSGGLFNVALGTTGMFDGTGPGLYVSLADVFRDHTGVWLEIQVGSQSGGGLETLSPRVRFSSSPYALNSTNAVSATNATNATLLNNQSSSSFINISNTPQSKGGSLEVGAPGNYVVLGGSSGAGYFTSSDTAIYSVVSTTAGVAGHFQGPSHPNNPKVDIAKGSIGIDVVAGHLDPNAVAVSGDGRAGRGGVFVGEAAGVRAFGTGSGYGILAQGGSAGGRFDGPGTAYALLGLPNLGLQATGPSQGGYFSNGSPWFSYAYIPNGDLGILARGPTAGGQFENFSTGSYGLVGYSSYKIEGSGAVSFVQNHPSDASKVIVYAAPEGDEVAVYTRGSGRLVDGEARVALGETFALVANPDIGLTATVTPRGEPIPLAVSEVSPGELVVRGPAGSNAAFDYTVWGLRIGFEDQSIIQPKRQDSKIPSMHVHEEFFKDQPELRDYTALARFKGVEEAVHGKRLRDFSRADKLRNAVGVFVPRPADAPPPEGWRGASEPPSPNPAEPGVSRQDGPPDTGLWPTDVPAVPSHPTDVTATADVEPVEAPEAHSDLPGRLYPPVIMRGVDLVEAGDVLSLDASSPGAVVRSAGTGDPLVIGCARAVEPGSIPDGLVAVDTGHITLCRVDASYGAVGVGDRLVASPSPGIAMRVGPSSADTGVFGRAIEPLEAGSGLIRVLVTVR